MRHSMAEVQQQLKDLGYDPGTIDGLWGPDTEAAVEQFQADLFVTGEVGPITEAAMFRMQVPVYSGFRMSDNGLAFLRGWEGCELEAYQDSVDVWTIGVGHTAAAGPPSPCSGMTITMDEADDILASDLGQYEDAVNDAILVAMTQNEFDAMTSLCFNIGQGAFSGSTLVDKMNNYDTMGAADQFLVWNKAGGQVVQGLVNRREAERELFLTADGAE